MPAARRTLPAADTTREYTSVGLARSAPKADVASGALRFVLVSGGGTGAGRATSSEIQSWIEAHGKAVTVSGASTTGWTLYDLSGAATTTA